MKKSLFILFSVCLIISCDNKKAGEQKTIEDKTKVEEKKTPDNKVSTDNNTPETKLNTDNTTTANTGWTEDDVNRFLYSCRNSATPKVGASRANEYCDCMIQKIKAKYKSYEEADQMLKASEEDMDILVNECNSQQ